MGLRITATWLGFAIGLAALILQFTLTMQLRLAAGDSIPGALVYFFSYFTILTNLMLVLIYLSELTSWRWLGWWRWPSTQSMMFGAILLVMVFYHFLLAGLWDPQGWQKVADVSLHYATPIIYVAWWLAFARHGQLRWPDLGLMVIPPALYLVYTLIRGAMINWYPYEVFNPGVIDTAGNAVGYGAVAMNIGMLLLALMVLWSIAIVLDRPLGGIRQKAAA